MKNQFLMPASFLGTSHLQIWMLLFESNTPDSGCHLSEKLCKVTVWRIWRHSIGGSQWLWHFLQFGFWWHGFQLNFIHLLWKKHQQIFPREIIMIQKKIYLCKFPFSMTPLLRGEYTNVFRNTSVNQSQGHSRHSLKMGSSKYCWHKHYGSCDPG